MSCPATRQAVVQRLKHGLPVKMGARLITERLRVKEMGPADHIRTKHEVKAFMESADASLAEQILARAQDRYQVQQSVTQGQSQQRGHRMFD